MNEEFKDLLGLNGRTNYERAVERILNSEEVKQSIMEGYDSLRFTDRELDSLIKKLCDLKAYREREREENKY